MSSPIPPNPPQPHTPHGADAVSHVVQAAEVLVERTVIAAERSLARRLGARGLRIVQVFLRVSWIVAVLAYFVFGLSVLATRYLLLPHIGDWKADIAAAAGAALHAPVAIGRIDADWQGLNPRLQLRDVVLLDANGGTVLGLHEVDLVLSWTTFLAWQPRMYSMTVLAPEIEVKRLRDHRYSIAGVLIDPQQAQGESSFLEWLLAQRHISVRDARVHFIDELEAVPVSAPAGESAADSAAPPLVPGEAAAPGQLDFTDVNFVLTRGLTGHYFALQLRPPSQLSGLVDVRGKFQRPWNESASRISSWSGRIFAQFDYVDVARLDALTHLVPAPARLDQARGALRTWLEFSAMQLTRMRADVALNDVSAQLAPELQPLRLDRLQGRVTETAWTDGNGDSREIALTGLQLDGPDNLHLPATDLLFRVTHGASAPAADAAGAPREQLRLEASRIVLSDWSRLAAHVPLPAEWLTLIERTAARGVIEDLQASWDGPASPPREYSLHARFSGLGFSLGTPAPAQAADFPGVGAPDPVDGAAASEFENLAGTVDLNQASGTLRIDASDVRMRLPTVFDHPQIGLDRLSTRLRWSREPGKQMNVDVDSLAAANEDIDLNISGAYRGSGEDAGDGAEPERLDISGRIARARVAAVARYLPNIVGAPARAWMQGALLDGAVTGGSLYLHGDPRRFPFADPASGEFHAALHVQDGKIDFAPGPADGGKGATGARPPQWPLLTGIEADVVFDRDRLSVNASHLRTLNYDLTNVSARLARLGQPDLHVLIDGQGSGPLSEILQYVVASPVNGYIGGFLTKAQGNGPAQLRLKLNIPVEHAADTAVAGSIIFRGNSLVLRHDIAPFSALTGQLSFNERGIGLTGVSAGYLGGEVHLGASTRPDGTVIIQGNGTAAPRETKRQVEPVAVQHMLDHARGLLRYSAILAVAHGTLELHVDTDLVGLAVDLPEPFRKAAAEARPLHIEAVPVAGAAPARDALRVTLGNVLWVELHRSAPEGGEGMRIERGAISIGTHANLPDNGLLLYIDQPHLDVDRWRQVLEPAAAETGENAVAGAAATGGTEAGGINLVAVHTASLTVSGKSITNVSLSARRDPDQNWLADIDSDQASGSLHWIGARPSAPGRLTARLAKLAIPEGDQKQVADLLDVQPTEFPALDIVADQFDLGSSKLGRLEVEAQNVASTPGSGRTDTWNLQKLTLTNPDGKFAGSGMWQRDGASPVRKMSIKVSLIFTNAGGLLARFGKPGTIKNGSGKLEGDLSWRGSPFVIDYQSLAGKLHVATEKGQFLKADAGAGRLLGVLSLQSLAHRLTGDFRDLFSEGFAFDSITASATIANGTLTTDDLIMKGVNAVVRIKGSADLHAETQNLQVVVIPEINAGTASLGYALVNPAIGLATFVANYLLRKPLSAAFTNIYEVTGPWSDPQVQHVAAEPVPAKDASQP